MLRNGDNLLRQANQLEQFDKGIGQIDFPPSVSMSGTRRRGMMIVVPAFAIGQQCNPPRVPAQVAGVVVLITPAMCGRVNEPGDVPDINRPHDDAHANICAKPAIIPLVPLIA